MAGLGALSVAGTNAVAMPPTHDPDSLLPDGFEPETPVDSFHPGEPRFVAVDEPLINPIWAVGFDAEGTPGHDGVPDEILFDKGRDHLAPRLPDLSSAPEKYDAEDFEWTLKSSPDESEGESAVLSFASDSTDVPRYDEGRDNVAEFRADAPGEYVLELEAPDGTHELTIYAFERGNEGASVYLGDPNGAPRIDLEAEYDEDNGEFTLYSNAEPAPNEDSDEEDLWAAFIADDRDGLSSDDIEVHDDGLTATVDVDDIDGDVARVHAAAYDEHVEKKSAQDVIELHADGEVSLPSRPPEWLSDSVMYQIFPRSWAGERWETTFETLIGGDEDLGAEGVDYLEDLGVDVLWITPVVPATSVQRQFAHRDDFDVSDDLPIDADEMHLSGGGPHGYDTADYTGISQDLAPDDEDALELYKDFIDACHEHGIKVLFDIVINHAGITNPLVLETWDETDEDSSGEWPVIESWDEDSPYFDWFDRADLERVDEDGEVLEAEPRITGFADLQVMPNLNFENLALREYLLGVADFWSREVGVDGFRADIAYGVPHDFWKELREIVRANDSEFLMFDESIPRDAALSENMFSLHHDTAGFMMTAHGVASDDAHGGSLFDTIPQRTQDGIPDHSMVINSLENHDEHRILNQAAVDLFDPNHEDVSDEDWAFYADRVRKCWAAAITMPGVPQLYYGQERQISRYGEGRHLGDDDDRGFEDGEINVDADVRPGGRQRAFMNWDEYDEDHLEFYKSLNEFYKEYEVLHPEASFEPVFFEVEDQPEDAELLLFGRDGSELDIEDGPERVTVVINFNEEPETVHLADGTDTHDLWTDEDVAADHDDDDDSVTIVEVDEMVVLETEDFGEEFELLATWDQEEGTDHGPGWYEYPTDEAFNDGAFDITNFEVREGDEHVQFAIELADLENAFDGEDGFSLQYPHIFVRDPGRENTREWAHFETTVRFESDVSLLIRAAGFGGGVEVFDADEDELEVTSDVSVDGDEIILEVAHDAFEADLADLELVPLMKGEDTGGIRQVTESGGDFEFEDTQFDDGDFPEDDPWTRHNVIDAVTPADVDNEDALEYGLPDDDDTPDEAVIPLLEMEAGIRNRFYPSDAVREHDGADGGLGPGTYLYPEEFEIPEGSIDIDRVVVYEDEESDEAAVAFEMDPEGLENQFDLPRGFSHPVPQVYIRNPDDDGGTTDARPGVRATLEDPYQYRVVADGEEMAEFEDADGDEVGTPEVELVEMDDAVVLGFSTEALEAPLADHELAFAVSAHDGFGPEGLRDVVQDEARQEWEFAGAQSENDPRVLDVVTPRTTTTEEALSATDDELATIPYLQDQRSVDDYIEDGEVSTESLEQAESDWEDGELTTDQLREVADIWRRGGDA